jgi:hypothetical protein
LTSKRALSLLEKHKEIIAQQTRGTICGVKQSGESVIIDELLETQPQTKVRRIMEAEGVKLRADALGRHARKECRCRP